MIENHMEIFITCTIIKEQYNYSQRALLLAVGDLAGISYMVPQDIENLLHCPPSTKQLVNALFDKGFSPKFIASHLDVTPSTITYHLKNKPERPYINKWLYNYQRYYQETYNNNEIK